MSRLRLKRKARHHRIVPRLGLAEWTVSLILNGGDAYQLWFEQLLLSVYSQSGEVPRHRPLAAFSPITQCNRNILSNNPILPLDGLLADNLGNIF